jgi:hypothetical protein
MSLRSGQETLAPATPVVLVVTVEAILKHCAVHRPCNENTSEQHACCVLLPAAGMPATLCTSSYSSCWLHVKLQLLASRSHLSMYELCVSFSFLISLRSVKASGVRPDALAASA